MIPTGDSSQFLLSGKPRASGDDPGRSLLAM